MSISHSPSDNHDGHKETENPSFSEGDTGLQACESSGLDETSGIISTNNVSSLAAFLSLENSSNSQSNGSWVDNRKLDNDREEEQAGAELCQAQFKFRLEVLLKREYATFEKVVDS